MTKHVHHDLIVKWAADSTVTVECRQGPNYPWQEVSTPSWNPQFEYRIQPRLIKKEGWVALFGNIKHTGTLSKYSSHVYSSKEAAEGQHLLDKNLVLVKIEWEEEEQV
jgi:hypothetical protein